MNFLFPSFLYALSAVSIPILIHLFNFRRYKKLYFSNVRFLKEVVQESRSRSRLKHWLVLLCRILIVVFLVLAFAQPFIPVKQGFTGAGNKAVSIFVDNSFSMNAISQNGTLLEDAKTKAGQIAQSLNASDKVQLVSQDFDEAQERWLNKDEFLEELKGLKTSPNSRALSEILKRQQENIQHAGCPVKEIFVLSDFQKSFSDINSFHPDNSITTDMVPITAEARNNISIDTCWFASPLHLPGKAEQISVKLTNYSTAAVSDAPVKLFLNGEEKAIASFNIAPQTSVTVNLSFIPSSKNIQEGSIKINDYPITFDDELYFSFKLSSHIPILWIHPDNMSKDPYLQTLYGKDSLFNFKDETSTHIDYSSLPQCRLIILDALTSIESGMSHEITNYLNQGGNVFIIPPATGMNTESYREMLTSLNSSYYEKLDTTRLKVDKLNYESLIYSTVFEKKQHPNMDLPVVTRHYIISSNNKTLSENLMKLENGNDFLDVFHYNKGSIYMLSVPLDDAYSNFQKHAIFVPTLYNMALYSLPNQPVYYTMGDMQPIEAPNITLPQNTFFKIQAAKDTLSILPERRVVNNSVLLFLHNQVTTAGNYKLTAADSLLSGISFNYNRKESDMSFLPTPELQKLCDDAGLRNFSVMSVSNASLSTLMQEVNRGKYYWKYCILLALLFLAAEELILRLWKE